MDHASNYTPCKSLSRSILNLRLPSPVRVECYAGSKALSKVSDVLFTIAALAAIAATLAPFIRSDVWWIRILDFPRIQIAIISALILAADLAFRTDAGLSAQILRADLALGILYQVYAIRPYTIFAGKEVESAKRPRKGSTLTLLLANVKMDNRNSALLREIIVKADPDIILAVEADKWWQRELGGFAKTHPFIVRQAQDNTYGMLLYSRLELIRPQVRFLVEDDVPSIRAIVKLPARTEVEIHCLHPRPLVPKEAAESTERDAELMVVGKESKGTELPIIVGAI